MNSFHSPYSCYHGKSIGRILHWIYNICGLNNAELVTVGDGEIKLGNELFATYVWERPCGVDVPRFVFTDKSVSKHYAIIHDRMLPSEIVLELTESLKTAKELLARIVEVEKDVDTFRLRMACRDAADFLKEK
jgi:hypothetical protein